MPRSAFIFWSKNLAPSLALNLAVQAISSAIFVAVEGWDYGTGTTRRSSSTAHV